MQSDYDVIEMFLVEFSGHVIQYNPPMGPHFESTKADVQKVEPRFKYIRTLLTKDYLFMVFPVINNSSR